MNLVHLALLALAAASSASATLLTNGNFEAGPIGAGTTPLGWTAATEIYVTDGNGYTVCCGASGNLTNRFVSFGGGDQPNTGSLRQTVATILGTSYLLSFDFAAVGQPGAPQTVTAQILNAGTLAVIASTNLTRNADNNLNTAFATQTLGFTGTGGNVIVAFQVDAATISVDGLLDNVSLNATPEPGTLGLILLGLGLAGRIGRAPQA